MTEPLQPLPRFRVALTEWSNWSQCIEAASAEEAQEIALRNWEENGSMNFKLRAFGLEEEIDVRPMDAP
ncbi:MAG TPA: hypothetical protein DCL54_19320 [Alphaproteobacteria bacterium]|nr:hypothetical protein [Alphaproteobacteria bacterium]